MLRDLLASEETALQADHSAQLDHPADLGSVAVGIVVKTAVSEISPQWTGSFPLNNVADVVTIPGAPRAFTKALV